MGVIVTILVALLMLAVILLGLWALALRANPSDPDFYGLAGVFYAHRGLHNSERSVPENSEKAFRLAVRYGYGAELDVHLSRDKRLVVMHDESLKRTAGLDMRICDVKADELARLRLEQTTQEIPYLEDILPIFDGQAPLIIEIKPCGKNYARLTYRVCKLLDNYPNLKFCIESFDPRVLIWLRRNRPEILRGQLSMNFLKERAGTKWLTAFVMTNLLLNIFTQPDFIAYRYEDRKHPAVWLCKKLWGTQEFSWTIRSQETADDAVEHGAIPIFEGFAAQ